MEYGGFDVFVRTWWKLNPSWPNGLEPCPGQRRYIAKGVTEERAREICKAYNTTHDSGKLSKKAEYESA
jgi:hypothetical protein